MISSKNTFHQFLIKSEFISWLDLTYPYMSPVLEMLFTKYVVTHNKKIVITLIQSCASFDFGKHIVSDSESMGKLKYCFMKGFLWKLIYLYCSVGHKLKVYQEYLNNLVKFMDREFWSTKSEIIITTLIITFLIFKINLF